MTAATVTLIGLMGAGKSKVGRLTAERLGRVFVDTDALVARRAGRSVADIFASDGEPAFRALERAAVADAVAHTGAVVSVGGGAVLDAANVTRMRAAGPVVWLYAEPATLIERLDNSLRRGDRPLLAAGDPLTVLTDLLARRRDAYAAAATDVVATDGLEVEQSVDLLAEWITEHAGVEAERAHES